jgi:iron complex outermembrane receptor protein
LVRIPDFTLNLGANYKHPIGYGSLEPSANVYWSSGWYQAFNNRLHQPSYTVVNTEIAWLLPNGKYKLAMWAKNLTGHVYTLMMSDSSNGDRLVFAPPRTYGVTLEVNF